MKVSFKQLRLGEDALSNKQRSLLSRTIEYAYRSSARQRHAAIIVKGGRVMNVGINRCHNNPRDYPAGMIDTCVEQNGIHAEVAAMRGVDEDILRGATIYVARVSPGGNVSLSKPCKRCTDALNKSGVRKVIYS